MITNEKRNKLIEENYKLVPYIVKKFFYRNFEYIGEDELISEGYCELVRCMRYYNEETGPVSTFICFCVKKHLGLFCDEYYKKRKDEISIEYLEDLSVNVPHYYDKYDDMKELTMITYLRQYLDERYTNIVIDYYYNKMKWKDIASKYGFSSYKAACSMVGEKLKTIPKKGGDIEIFKELFL